MQLKHLINKLEIVKTYGDLNVEILGVSFNSKQVKSGDVFVCLKGDKNGLDFVQEARQNGAIAVVLEDDVCCLNLPTIIVKNARISLSLICKVFYDNACDNLKIIMITGTNGKTSVSYLIYSMLCNNNYKCALIGTNGIYYDNNQLYYGLTTPDPTDLHFYFKQLKNMGVTHVVMEVSAHAIKLNKLCGIYAEQIIFTNLTNEHLDYFLTMENYAKTKLDFVNKNNTKIAITNVDDFYGKQLLNSSVPTITYGLANPADTFALNITNSIHGLKFCVNVMDEIFNVNSGLSGVYNVYNLLAAITSAHCLGLSNNAIKIGIEKMQNIPGRFKKYFLDLNRLVVVDFAHTPDGFEKILSEIRTFRSGKIITLFGCVGYSDSNKRTEMGKVASKYSNQIILTTDNPNFTDFNLICSDVILGISVPYETEFDRGEAVRKAFLNLQPNQTLVLLGKGCETSNLINGVKVPYSDMEKIENLIQEFYNVKKGDQFDSGIV